ncbi:MAG: cold shock domain-containing protein [Bacteroidetes bacterium]|nr:cold shock domain-containing protein [Bacteroidota bacterium]
MKTGTVKFFNVTKGFGFIKEDNSDQEIFVHASGLVDQIREADKVTFEVTEGKKGLNAVNVKKLNHSILIHYKRFPVSGSVFYFKK